MPERVTRHCVPAIGRYRFPTGIGFRLLRQTRFAPEASQKPVGFKPQQKRFVDIDRLFEGTVI